MPRLRSLSAGVSILLLAGVLAACGGGAPEAAQPTSAPSAAEPTAAAPAAAPTAASTATGGTLSVGGTATPPTRSTPAWPT